MTAATRLVVHTLPMKSYRSAPFAGIAGNCAPCSVVSFGVAPGGGWRLRASTPPSRARVSHILTAASLAPSAAAIAFPVHPS